MLKRIVLVGLSILVVFAFLGVYFSFGADTSLKTDKFKVKGMCCENCAGKVSEMLSALPGVEKVEVNFEKKVALVTYDKKQIEKGEIKESLSELERGCSKEGSKSEMGCSMHKDGSSKEGCAHKKDCCKKMGEGKKDEGSSETKSEECPYHKSK